ncbi:vacuolar sorting protein, putative [Candida dubliniensis CD36]|uniref:Vacuolar sorting protein, putative n=1 Tax=Candida dubliniensis (strain CD36 / ATCC MYA-646 / CBS 7987 / NCPF 3949 / NRRL Y-17841) TaxID=573826 RepID=B9W7I6_CANDC|nr:vacuolar sorting protein, putative [Candida dubliniensis CD36]CAX44646.1 vacuolar sorting protein, putative [Candida dubliniensis CD36]
MEKFSSWRDKGTGISPFMPQKLPTFQNNIILSVASKSPIFLIKLPFFIITYLIYTITGLNFILKFILTILFGFNRIEFTVDGIKKSQIDKLIKYKPQKGDLIITNYITPLDGYFLSLLSGNNSKIVLLIPNKSGDLYQYSPLGLFNYTFNYNDGGKLIQDLSKLQNKIVFLFLEGTPSNNKSILPFIKLNSKYSFNDNFIIKSLIVKLKPNYFTLPIPHITTKLQYFFELLTNLSPKIIHYKIYKFDNEFNISKIRNSFELNSLTSISQDLNIDSKNKFIDYYFDHSIKKN